VVLVYPRGYEKKQMKTLREFVASIMGRVKRNEV
jgi:hypothetical protein